MIKWLEKHKVISLILTCLIVLEIFYFSSLSFGQGGQGFSFIPIIYHFTVFFLLAFFTLVSIKGEDKFKAKYFFIVFAFSILYAILDETHQLFVPFRSASFQDILVDTAGIISSMIIYKIQK